MHMRQTQSFHSINQARAYNRSNYRYKSPRTILYTWWNTTTDVMLNSKSYTYQFLRVKPLEISYSPVIFFSDRDEVLLVSEEFVLTKELGIR